MPACPGSRWLLGWRVTDGYHAFNLLQQIHVPREHDPWNVNLHITKLYLPVTNTNTHTPLSYVMAQLHMFISVKANFYAKTYKPIKMSFRSGMQRKRSLGNLRPCYSKHHALFFFFLNVNHFLNLYWICYNVAYVLFFGCWRHVGSSDRDWTHTPCIGRQSLHHWTTREVPCTLLLRAASWGCWLVCVFFCCVVEVMWVWLSTLDG